MPLVAVFVLFLLIFSVPGVAFAFANGENANVVLGQTAYTAGGAATTSTGLSLPTGTAFDSSGNLWVSDFANNRVLEYAPPFTVGEAASVVIGQTSFTSSAGATTQTGLNEPAGLAFDSAGNLWVVEYGNARVMEFTKPFSTGEAASVVIGQTTFTSSTSGLSQSQFFEPWAIAFDHSGNLWVSDHGNSRVLEFVPPFTDGMLASIVIGQTDFFSSLAQNTQGGLGDPFGIAFDASNNLYVADGWNRVMVFDSPFVTGELASIVIGQTSFTAHVGATSKGGLDQPEGLAFGPAGNLWVADLANDRVLEYKTPFSTGQLALLVVGQVNFVSNGFATTQSGLFEPYAVTIGPGGALWVADGANNRVLRFPAKLPTTTAVSCTPSSVTSGSPTTCTATVTDTGGGMAATPKGTVTFTSSLAGTFSSTTCTLSGSGTTSTCSVTFTPSSSGKAVITGSYAATGAFTASKGKFTVTVT